MLGERLGRLLGPGDVIGLVGELGAGKTVFAQGTAAGLGARGRVTSPTFTLVHEHPGVIDMYHIDVYRLETLSDADALALEDYIYGDGVAVVEWADKFPGLLPKERLDIEIRRPAGSRPAGSQPAGGPPPGAGDIDDIDDSTREIVLIARGSRFERVVEELRAIACPRN